MTVIAMSQEMATLGKDVALGICEALGLQQVRHEVGDVVAGRMHVKNSLIRRIREGKASKVERWSADEKTISIFTAEEVYDLAVKGNVLIRGWGATMLLGGVPHVPRDRAGGGLLGAQGRGGRQGEQGEQDRVAPLQDERHGEEIDRCGEGGEEQKPPAGRFRFAEEKYPPAVLHVPAFSGHCGWLANCWVNAPSVRSKGERSNVIPWYRARPNQAQFAS